MQTIGLSELALLFVIGLLILGPERLPRVASQLGRWVGRARRTANQLRYQLEREVSIAELEKTRKPNVTPGPRPDTAPQQSPAASSDSSAADGSASPPAKSESDETIRHS